MHNSDRTFLRLLLFAVFVRRDEHISFMSLDGPFFIDRDVLAYRALISILRRPKLYLNWNRCLTTGMKRTLIAACDEIGFGRWCSQQSCSKHDIWTSIRLNSRVILSCAVRLSSSSSPIINHSLNSSPANDHLSLEPCFPLLIFAARERNASRFLCKYRAKDAGEVRNSLNSPLPRCLIVYDNFRHSIRSNAQVTLSPRLNNFSNWRELLSRFYAEHDIAGYGLKGGNQWEQLTQTFSDGWALKARG